MNISLPYVNATLLHDIVWHMTAPEGLANKIREAQDKKPETVTFDLTLDDYHYFVETLQSKETPYSPACKADLLKTLNDCVLPLFVEEAVEATT